LHTRLRDLASDVVSVRNLAGLGEMSHTRAPALGVFHPESFEPSETSQASFPRSVTLPQLPSPGVAFL